MQEPQQKYNVIAGKWKNFQLPDELSWISVNSRKKSLQQSVLKDEIDGLKKHIKKLEDELHTFQDQCSIREFKDQEEIQKQKQKRKTKEEMKIIRLQNQMENKVEEKIEQIIEVPEGQQLCKCCNKSYKKHKCAHNLCATDCAQKVKDIKQRDSYRKRIMIQKALTQKNQENIQIKNEDFAVKLQKLYAQIDDIMKTLNKQEIFQIITIPNKMENKK